MIETMFESIKSYKKTVKYLSSSLFFLGMLLLYRDGGEKVLWMLFWPMKLLNKLNDYLFHFRYDQAVLFILVSGTPFVIFYWLTVLRFFDD